MAEANQKKRYRRATYIAGQDLAGINACLDAYKSGAAPQNSLPQGVDITSISVVRHNDDSMKSPPGVLSTPGHYVVIGSKAGNPPDGWPEVQAGAGGGGAAVSWTANGGTQTETGLEERLFRSKDSTLTAKQWMASDGKLRFVEVVKSVEETAGRGRVPRKRAKRTPATASVAFPSASALASAATSSSSASASASASSAAAADLERGGGDIGTVDEALLREALLSDDDTEFESVEHLSDIEKVVENIR